MIIYALNEKKNYPDLDVIIVTEETDGGNDNKEFKKIPAICKILEIQVKTLPELLKTYDGIDIEFK